jgi:hypothetical protein
VINNYEPRIFSTRKGLDSLIVMTPDIGAQYFRDVGAVVNVGGPPDRAQLMAIMSKYGLVPAPPK